MALDAGSLAEKVLSAMKGQLGGAGANEEQILAKAAARLAKGLVDIEADRARGELTDDQARLLISSAADDAKAILQTELGVAELNAKGIVIAGLKVLASVALTAAGLGWADPIVQAVIGSFQSGN